jgi:hypothetical protein
MDGLDVEPVQKVTTNYMVVPITSTTVTTVKKLYDYRTPSDLTEVVTVTHVSRVMCTHVTIAETNTGTAITIIAVLRMKKKMSLSSTVTHTDLAHTSLAQESIISASS